MTTKKSHKTDQKIKAFIIEAIDASGYDADPETTQEKIDFLRETFESEYGWHIAQAGRQKALQEWLQGLPSSINIPYTYTDIISLAKATGGLAADATEAQEDRICENYWNYMSAKIGQLFDGYRVPVIEQANA